MDAIASSSSTSPSEKIYDVFLSFRGADTRYNFLSHLHNALCRAKIKTFIDDDLTRGDDVPEALLRTIEKSKISIVIFSENYAGSRWCLHELVQIMECKEKNAQIVIPVFLNVDPTHVRHQSKSFARNLAKHGDHPMIQRWRDVLTKAANLSRWDSKVIRHEATLIKNITSTILDKLYNTCSSTCGDLVGMTSRLEQLDQILKTIPNEVRIIGFWGMGGIGKSTLAKAFFNHVFSRFEGCYIIQNFRETCEKCGRNELLDKLVSGLLKDENLNIGTPSLEISFIRDRLRRMNVLVVLDDVSDFTHIELLVGKRDCLGPGSIVIITSRDQQVLKNGVDKIYEVLGLDDHEAFCLFAQHAFKVEYPKDDYRMKLAKRAINYANGNPLALKVLGSYLFGKSNEEQESALRKLERIPNKDIQKVLRISYDGLDNEEKNIFLNIACFFNIWSIDDVKCFHDSCGFFTDIGICDLVDKSLITLSTFGSVIMHDLLKELGREIVREECIEEPGKRSRLWDYDDIYHVLTKNTETKAIKGIRLELDSKRIFSINPVAFERMENLEFFQISSVDSYSSIILSQGLGYLPNQLRYLDWARYPLTYLPSNFHGENLTHLIMRESKIVRLWHGRQELPHLRVINLFSSYNLIEIPDLSMAPNLQDVCLFGCSKIKKFPTVSINCVTSLIELNLGDCNRLENLPDDIYKWKSLESLNISSTLQEKRVYPRELTDSLGCLSALKQLDISGGNFLKIPVSIRQLTNLKHLFLRNCKRLQSLPQLPMNIQYILAYNCVSLEVVASPFTTVTREEFDYVAEKDKYLLDFYNCFKLNKNAQNSITTYAELKLLQWTVGCLETCSQRNRGNRIVTDAELKLQRQAFDCPKIYSPRNRAIEICFTGRDIPDQFKYKSSGSSLTVELPKYWCNSNLFCLGAGIVVEFKDFRGTLRRTDLEYDWHIKNNIGDRSSGKGSFNLRLTRPIDVIPSNHVFLRYEQSFMINEWRMIQEETKDDAAVTSIELHLSEDIEEFWDGTSSRDYYEVKKCGIHLLYRHETEDRCRTSRIDSDSLSGSSQFFFNPGSMEEDIEEIGIGDAKGDGGSDENYCNMENLWNFHF